MSVSFQPPTLLWSQRSLATPGIVRPPTLRHGLRGGTVDSHPPTLLQYQNLLVQDEARKAIVTVRRAAEELARRGNPPRISAFTAQIRVAPIEFIPVTRELVDGHDVVLTNHREGAPQIVEHTVIVQPIPPTTLGSGSRSQELVHPVKPHFVPPSSPANRPGLTPSGVQTTRTSNCAGGRSRLLHRLSTSERTVIALFKMEPRDSAVVWWSPI